MKFVFLYPASIMQSVVLASQLFNGSLWIFYIYFVIYICQKYFDFCV